MNLKSFLIASLLIHLVGAISLYFYYNPISLQPKSVYKQEDKLKTEEKQTELKTEEKELEKIKKEQGLKNSKKDLAKQDKVKKFVQKNKKKKPLSESLTKNKEENLKLEQPEEAKRDDTIEEESEELFETSLIEEEPMELSSGNRLNKQEFRDFSSLNQKAGNSPLSYPNFARKRALEGTVSLLFFVDDRGLVEKLQLENSSGHPDLDNFVLRQLAQYQFLENQKGWVRFKKTFVLKGKESEYLRLRQLDNPETAELEGLAEEQKALEDSKAHLGIQEEDIEKNLETAEPLDENPEIEFIEYEN